MGELPNRIRVLREARGWSLDRLATLVGTSKIQISELERGLKPLTFAWMKRIAPHLEVTAGELLNSEDNALALSEDELALIASFRSATDEGQTAISSVADAVSAYRAPKQEEAA
jgi:transcriptional regulator with XRE-family HTH domain